ncbi:MAG TPA: FAD-dependent oxidoreductase [Casimicrobiaceae bacterium]|nr:FAD-dependent oxidoreductase [Casimicrobiaceae bacterium]
MTKHVVVIGAGIVGLCAAHYCRQRGWDVTVVERNGERRDGCSFGNAGMIVPSHFVPLAAPGAVALALRWMSNPASPFYVKPRASWDLVAWGLRFWRAANSAHVARAAPVLRDLNLASRDAHEALARALGLDVARTGTLMLCKTRHALAEEARTAALAQRLGIAAEVLDAQQTAALEPSVRMDVIGSAFFPGDAHVDPERLVNALQQDLARRGTRFVWNAEVSEFVREGARIRAIRVGAEDIAADDVVLAAGSWSAKLARMCGLTVPLQPGKGYSLTLREPRALPQRAAILTEARVAVSAMGSTLRFGGTMELAGFDDSINPMRVRSIVAAASRYYPDFESADFDAVQAWRGFRPCSPDGVPYLGRSAQCPNLVVATGHAMMGVSLAPITGSLVSQVIAGEPPDIDIALLSPDRYH